MRVVVLEKSEDAEAVTWLNQVLRLSWSATKFGRSRPEAQTINAHASRDGVFTFLVMS